MPPRVLVVIPAYNEERTIGLVASKAARHAPVLVVDDGSRDRTGEVASAVPGCTVIRHERNTHIPEGIRDGFRYALEHGFDYAITMDAGMSHDPEAIPAFIQAPSADLLLSYRRERRQVPLYRRALSYAAKCVVNWAIRKRRWLPGRPLYRDVTSGYRRYSRRAMEAVLAAPMVCRSFDFHFEALSVVHYAGLSIGEFPIAYTFTTSSLNRKVFWQALKTWWKLLRGLHRTHKRQ